MTRAIVVQVAPGSARFGIRFAPGGLAPLLGAPLSLLTDGDAALGALRPRAWRVPLQELVDAADFDARCRIVWRSIVGALPVLAPDHALIGLLARLDAAPRLPRVEALAAAAGLGRRTLERRFGAALGVSPVQHLRWLRFERARRLLGGGRRAHADIALDAGYADQAHFIREFARFSGLTPGRWPG